MENRPDIELKQIALDLFHGRIYTDRHVRKGEDIGMVFMVLLLMDEAAHEKLRADPPGMVYEYLSEAGPRSCNGQPMFLSMRMISQHDTEKVFEYVSKLQQAQEAVLGEAVQEGSGEGI